MSLVVFDGVNQVAADRLLSFQGIAYEISKIRRLTVGAGGRYTGVFGFVGDPACAQQIAADLEEAPEWPMPRPSEYVMGLRNIPDLWEEVQETVCFFVSADLVDMWVCQAGKGWFPIPKQPFAIGAEAAVRVAVQYLRHERDFDRVDMQTAVASVSHAIQQCIDLQGDNFVRGPVESMLVEVNGGLA